MSNKFSQARVQVDFLLAFYHDMPFRPRYINKLKRYVSWRGENNTVEQLSLRVFTWPEPPSSKEPATIRICINHCNYALTETAAHSLGFKKAWVLSHGAPSCTKEFVLEWTVMADELQVMSNWLPTWISGRFDTSVAVPMPPVPSSLGGAWWLNGAALSLRNTCYAWSTRAWEATTSWRGQDPTLNSDVIPADKVTPALAELPGENHVEQISRDENGSEAPGEAVSIGACEAEGGQT